MTQLAVRFNRRPNIPASNVLEWSLVADQATVNEGSPATWTLTLNRHGATPVPCSISVSGQTVSLPSGTFQAPGDTISDMIDRACQATIGATWGGAGDFHRIFFDATFAGTIAFSRGTVNNPAAQGAITSISNASPGVVTTTAAHGLLENTVLRLTTSGALPTGLAAGTNYFVKVVDTTHFQLSATSGGAAINTSSNGSGTHLYHLRAGLKISSVSLGSIITAGDIFQTITDAGVVNPGGGALHHLTFDTGTPVYLTMGAVMAAFPVNTLICEVLGWDASNAAVVPDSVALNDTLGSRFKIVQTGSGGSSRFFIYSDTGAIDFESATQPFPLDVRGYLPTVTGTKGANTAQLQLQALANWPVISPTGNVSGPTTSVGDFTALATAVNSSAANRTVDYGSFTGILEVALHAAVAPSITPTVDKALSLKASNFTWEGKATVALHTKKGPNFVQGTNIIIRKQKFMSGVEIAKAVQDAGGAGADIDSGTVGVNPTGWIRWVIFDRCEFSCSNDELHTITSEGKLFASRGIRFTRCLFADPFWAGYHSKGPNHNHGPDIYGNCMYVVYDKCAIVNCDFRMPYIQRNSHHSYVVNCYIGEWLAKSTASGLRIQGTNAGGNILTDANPLSTRIEANLFFAPSTSTAGYSKRMPIPIDGADPVKTWIYVETSDANYKNHFCVPATSTFTSDPLTDGDGIDKQNCTLGDPLKTYPNFHVTGMTIMRTNDDAARLALFNDIFGTDPANPNVGCGSKHGQDVVALVKAGTMRINTTPPQFDALYGSGGGTSLDSGGTKWAGGGSLGHGAV